MGPVKARHLSPALVILHLCALAQSPATETRTVAAGIRYEQRTLDGPLSIHILEVDPKEAEIFAGRALGDGVGRETVSSIARRNGALAAVNGSFFGKGGRYDGDSSGMLRIRGEWFSDAPIPRGVVGWKEGGRRAQIGRVTTRWSVEVSGWTLPVSGVNRNRSSRDAVLYTWAFHRSTLTNPDGVEIRVQDGKVLEVRQGGDSGIPPEGYVLSIGPRFEMGDRPLPEPGSEAAVRVAFEAVPPLDWQDMEFAVGGTPVIIEQGAIVEDYTPEGIASGFIQERHPRTAVGLREDGSWVLIVVDGRKPDFSVGMTLRELAEFMRALGCVSALNMDGGGSSTLYLEGRVANSPSDISGERPVSDAILIRSR